MTQQPTHFTREEIQHLWMSLEAFLLNSSFMLEYGNPRDYCDFQALAERFPELKANVQQATCGKEAEIAEATQAMEELESLDQNSVEWEIELERQKAQLCLRFIDAGDGADPVIFPEDAIAFLIELMPRFSVNALISSRLPMEAWNAFHGEIEAATGIDLWFPFRPFLDKATTTFFQDRFNILQSIITKLKTLYEETRRQAQTHRDRHPHCPDRVLGTDDSQ